MSEDRFYEQVRKTMGSYAPEVPQQVYGKMRRALWWSNFTKMSATRFNMWYAILILGAGSGAVVMATGNSCDASAAINAEVHPVITVSDHQSAHSGNGCVAHDVVCTTQNTAHCQPVAAKETQAQVVESANVVMVPAENTAGDAITETQGGDVPEVVAAQEAAPETVVVKSNEKPKKNKGRGLSVPVIVDEKTAGKEDK